MKEWTDEQAALTVDVGTGWIARYEFEGLTVGSVIRSTLEAGMNSTARLNGEFFACVSVIVVADSQKEFLGAFISNFEETENMRPGPARGDEATELLPFAVRMCSIQIKMRDLDGTGLYSVINFDSKISEENDAELIVAGIAVAKGKVVVIGENMGLRVTELLCKMPQGSLPRMTGSVFPLNYSAEKIKNYNFRMPDCFTKRAIMRAETIHREFLRGYQSRFPETGEWKLDFIDQLNYGEWLDDKAKPAGQFLSFRPAVRRRDYVKEGISRLPKKFLVEASAAAFPFSGNCITGLRDWAARLLEKTEALPFQIALGPQSKTVLEKDPGFDIGLACLRNGWFALGDIRIGSASSAESAVISTTPCACEARNRWGMILLARFSTVLGEKMDIVYPEDLLSPFLSALGR